MSFAGAWSAGQEEGLPGRIARRVFLPSIIGCQETVRNNSLLRHERAKNLRSDALNGVLRVTSDKLKPAQPSKSLHLLNMALYEICVETLHRGPGANPAVCVPWPQP